MAVNLGTLRQGPTPYLGWYLEGRAEFLTTYIWYANEDREDGASFRVTTNARKLPSPHLQQYEEAQRAGLAVAKGKIFLGTWQKDKDDHIILPLAQRKVATPLIRHSILRGLHRLYEEGFEEGDFQVDLDGVALELGVKPELVTRAVKFLHEKGLIEEYGTLGRNWSTGDVWLSNAGAEYIEAREATQSRATESATASNEMFFPAGKVHDAYKEVRDLISRAVSEVWIEDNYVDNTLFDLLSNLPSNVEVRLLTQKRPRDFPLELKKFREQHGLEMEVRTSESFHDRFILVDDQCYHLGASIKDVGKKAFMLSQLEDPANVKAVRSDLEKAWQSGTPI